MGSAVAQAVCDDPDLDFVAAIDPSYDGIDVGEVTGVQGCTFAVSGDAQAMVDANVAVAIDFTHVEAARTNLRFCADNAIHAVVGTSGLSSVDCEDLARQFSSSNCVVAPNFAIGAVLMMRFAEMAAPFFETAEVIELHHDAKIDAPSGTAIATVERMAAASDDWAADPTKHETIPGARGAKGDAGIAVHSVRMRGLVAHQEVILGTMGQTLTIRHDSYDRSSFMPGVVLAIKAIGSSDGFTVGLDRVLGL